MLSTSKQLAKRSRDDLLQLLSTAIDKLEQIDFTNDETIQQALNELLVETGEKPVTMFGITRFALTWAKFSPGLPETMMLLGKDETLARLNDAINN